MADKKPKKSKDPDRTSTVRPPPIGGGRGGPAALLAGAAALGGSALGYPAIADAASEWDVTATTNCDKRTDILWLEGEIVDLAGAHPALSPKKRACGGRTGPVHPPGRPPPRTRPGRLWPRA